MLKLTLGTALTASLLLGTVVIAPEAHAQKRRFDAVIPLEELDANGNGELTFDEMQAALEAKFEGFDADNSGFITLNDLPLILPLTEKQEERRQRRLAKIQERMSENGIDIDDEQLEARGLPTRMRFMARHDKDADEAVSFEEFSKPATRMFNRVDQNGDGTLTEEEIEQAKRFMKRKRRQKRRG